MKWYDVSALSGYEDINAFANFHVSLQVNLRCSLSYLATEY